MKTTKKVPRLRFRGFSDEWALTKLGSLDVYVSDGNYGEMYPKVSEMQSSGVPFIRANNIKNGHLVWDDMKYISSDLHKVLISGHLESNDILITTRGDIGAIAYVTEEFDGSNINAQICLLRTGKDLDTKYLFQYLGTQQGKSQFEKLQSGSALKQLPKGKLALVEIGITSKLEQEKIAGFLGVVDDKISALQDKKELLQKYKKGATQAIFSQKVRFTDENSKNYSAWQENKLGALATITTGRKDVNAGNPKGKYPFYTCAKDHTYSDYYSFDGEAILIAGNAEVGLCQYYVGKFEAYQRTYVLQNFRILGTYLFRYLSHYFRQYALGLKQTGAMSFIKIGMLNNFNVPVPAKGEQKKIADFLTSLDGKINLTEKELEQAKRFKSSLLQQMFV